MIAIKRIHPQTKTFPLIYLSRSNHSQSSNKSKNLYTVLGVKYNSDLKEIKDNFYKLSKEYHPDLNKDDEVSLLKFKEIAEAYEILGNAEKRREYDKLMDFNPKSANNKAGSGSRGQRSHGMKGTFRNGTFVDDDEPPQMRDIQYDLSPEKMEKIWSRYKARWERVDELKRVEELEKKKEEFRRKIDAKRKRLQNMSEEEKEEFLYKLRYLRTDAADDSNEWKSVETKKSSGIFSHDFRNSDKRKHEKIGEDNMSHKKAERIEFENILKAERIEHEKLMKDVIINQFGYSEKAYEEMNKKDHSSTSRKTSSHDPFYEGLNSSKDAPNWQNLLNRTVTNNKEKWKRVYSARENNAFQCSHKHDVYKQGELKFGIIVFYAIFIGAFCLGLSELRHNTDS